MQGSALPCYFPGCKASAFRQGETSIRAKMQEDQHKQEEMAAWEFLEWQKSSNNTSIKKHRWN